MTVEPTKTLGYDFVESVFDMMVAYEQVDGDDFMEHSSMKASFPSQEVRDLRWELIREEVKEYFDADASDDLVEIADALGDIMVVVAGAAIAYGIDLPAVLAEIQRSNFSKLNPATGKVKKRDDGKALKDSGWTAPDISSVM